MRHNDICYGGTKCGYYNISTDKHHYSLLNRIWPLKLRTAEIVKLFSMRFVVNEDDMWRRDVDLHYRPHKKAQGHSKKLSYRKAYARDFYVNSNQKRRDPKTNESSQHSHILERRPRTSRRSVSVRI